MSGEVTPGLRELLSKQTCYVVEQFGSKSGTDMSTIERETGDLDKAHVVSSLVRPVVPDDYEGPLTKDDLWIDDDFGPNLHIVVLDIDHQAHLVDSSTPGHSHLYVEIPPVSWTDYVAFLEAAAKIGLVEPGYVEASKRRGHTDVRLPWIKKGDVAFGRDQTGDIPTLPALFCFRCRRRPHEIEEYVAETRASLELSSAAICSAEDVEEWVRGNEGTVNAAAGLFACTDCYIKVGQPSAEWGWKPFEAVPPDSATYYNVASHDPFGRAQRPVEVKDPTANPNRVSTEDLGGLFS